MLAMFINEHQDDWDDHLPYVMMAYRALVQESTGCTQNLQFFGRDIKVEYVEWVLQASELAFEYARENLQTSAVRQKRLYDG